MGFVKGCLVLAVGAILLLVAGVMIYRWPSTYRYRLTVEVETPQGLKTGSAVREVVWRREPELTPESAASSFKQRGEAAAVDLPGGQVLFALLDVNAGETVHAGFESLDEEAGTVPVKRLLDRAEDSGVLHVFPDEATLAARHRHLPRLVRFRDLADPTSVEAVDPDNLAASFGEGVKLKRITIQITDDPVTTGIEKRLGWLPKHAGSLAPATLDDSEERRRLAAITPYDLKRGND